MNNLEEALYRTVAYSALLRAAVFAYQARLSVPLEEPLRVSSHRNGRGNHQWIV
jgi:hypothetical protein